MALEVQQMAAMNESGFNDQAIFGHNKSVDCDDYYNYSHYNGNCTNYTGTGQQELDTDTTLQTVENVIWYVSCALGIPGNILSAIVWLRRHVTSKNSSAIYLGVMAINDFVFTLVQLIVHILSRVGYHGRWFYLCCWYLVCYTRNLEPLLVLGFSVERLIAIVRPFQVCCIFIVLARFVWQVSLMERFLIKNISSPNIWTIISKHKFKTM